MDEYMTQDLDVRLDEMDGEYIDVLVCIKTAWQFMLHIPNGYTWYDVLDLISDESGIPALKIDLVDRYVNRNELCNLQNNDELSCAWYGLDDDDHPIHQASRNGNTAAIEKWVTCGVDVNILNSFGSTPLMDAVVGRQYNSAKLLLRLGADPNITDNKWFTVMHIIAYPISGKNNYTMIKLLIDNKGDTSVVNIFGKTPFDIANELDWGPQFEEYIATATSI